MDIAVASMSDVQDRLFVVDCACEYTLFYKIQNAKRQHSRMTQHGQKIKYRDPTISEGINF